MSDRECIYGGSAEARCHRRVVDLLGPSLPLDRSEAEWLLPLLGAEELVHIFEGSTNDQDPD